MPRRPRLKLAGIPVHFIQRGNNRGACFFAEDDYQFYLDHLGEACKKYEVELHAYVLMKTYAKWGIHMSAVTSTGCGLAMVGNSTSSTNRTQMDTPLC